MQMLPEKMQVFETKINYIREEQKLTVSFVKENLSDSYGVYVSKRNEKRRLKKKFTSQIRQLILEII